jgi:hypothetical protein
MRLFTHVNKINMATIGRSDSVVLHECKVLFSMTCYNTDSK